MDLKHYAKGMCNLCYHLYGRNKNASKCEHTFCPSYAKGMCQNCYFNTYNKKKRTCPEKSINRRKVGAADIKN